MLDMESSVMATPGDNQVSIDLADLMEVVTLYKCKFCDFSCNQPQGIGEHVQAAHAITQLKQPPKQVSQNLVGISLPPSDGAGHKMAPAAVTYEAGTQATSMESTTLNTSLPHEMLAEDIPEQRSHMDAVDRIIDGADDNLQMMDSGAPGEEMTVNKEIYLCGQCNLGFDSMENCKNHMIRDHQVGVEGEEGQVEVHVPGEVVFPPNRISVGTQVMTRKKPGRKRKVKPDVKLQMSVEDEFEEEMAQQEKARKLEDREGEVFEEGTQEDTGGSSSPEKEVGEKVTGAGRRKRRLPARLASLYYMGKRSPVHPTTRHPPPAKIKVEPHNIRCLKVGCNARFRTQTSMDLHLACHKNVAQGAGRREVFVCPRCDVTEPLWKTLRVHLWKEHKIDTDLHTCETCGFKVDSVFRLERHVQIHSEDRPYICDVCEKGFKQASQLQNHKAVHADRAEPNKWYSNKVCDICERTFANQKSLRIHIDSVHSKERRFVCPYCNHATSRKAILDLHVRTHTGEKPFKCDMCTYMTGDHNSLRRHKMRHTGEKPYKCRYCPYSAIQAISLKTHMKNKHPGSVGVFFCNQCPYQTVNEQYYTQHQMDHKNGLVQAVRLPPQQQQQSTAGSSLLVRPARGQSLLRVATPIQPHPPPSLPPSLQRLVTLPDGRQVVAVHPNDQPPAGPQTISAADLAKLANMGMIHGGQDTAQLICTALNAISGQGGGGSSSGAQPTVQSTTHEGVTTHTITFHIPPENGSSGEEAEVAGTERQEPGAEQQPAANTEPTQMVEVVEGDIGHGQMLLQQQHHEQHVIVDEAEVTYTTEVGPDGQEVMQQLVVQPEEGEIVETREDQVVMEITPDETMTENTPTEVSAYEATASEDVPHEGQIAGNIVHPRGESAEPGEVLVMEVMDSDGNIKKTQVKYIMAIEDQS